MLATHNCQLNTREFFYFYAMSNPHIIITLGMRCLTFGWSNPHSKKCTNVVVGRYIDRYINKILIRTLQCGMQANRAILTQQECICTGTGGFRGFQSFQGHALHPMNDWTVGKYFSSRSLQGKWFSGLPSADRSVFSFRPC